MILYGFVSIDFFSVCNAYDSDDQQIVLFQIDDPVVSCSFAKFAFMLAFETFVFGKIAVLKIFDLFCYKFLCGSFEF